MDFVCIERKLIIEIDGGQHDLDRRRDSERTQRLEAMGYLVVRFWNNDVLHNMNGVLQMILDLLEQK